MNDRTHGLQFRAAFLKATAPTTLEGIEKYLGSGMIRGIGPVYAKKLVRAFGEAVFDLIEQQPDRLREVTGIGPKQALNPPGEVRVERFGWIFGPGDKVMQVVNDYERQVYNGDLGGVAQIDWRRASWWSTTRAARSPTASPSWTS